MKVLKYTLCGILLMGSLFFTSTALKADETSVASVESISIENKDELNPMIHELETLFVLMQERLAIMHDVARYKWNNELNDQVLKGELLSEQNTNESSQVNDFLAAQNKAAEKLQEQDFNLFEKEGITKFENVKDYETQIQPELLSLNEKILASIHELLVQTQNESLPVFLKEISFNSFKNEGIDRNVYDTAVAPLFND